MTTNQQLPIIILVDERDDITHTTQWPQCKDMICPCHEGDDLWQDEMEDEAPSEAEVDAQERAIEPAYDAPHCPQCGHLYAYGNRSHLCDECSEPITSGARSIDWSKILD